MHNIGWAQHWINGESEKKNYQKISTKLTLPFGKGEEKQKKKVFPQISNDL